MIKKKAAVLTVFISIMMLGGCSIPKQKEWVEQMNKLYPDDVFTHEGVYSGELGLRSDIAEISSKNMPERHNLYIKEEGGKLLSNYDSFKYEDDINGYLEDLFEEKFEGCEVEGDYVPWFYSEIGPSDFDDFLDGLDSLDKVCVILHYDEGTDLPSEDTVSQKLIDIEKENDGFFDYVSLYLVYGHPKDCLKEYRLLYTVKMDDEDTIKYVRVERKTSDGRKGNALAEDIDI